jgi:hypothetical protein
VDPVPSASSARVRGDVAALQALSRNALQTAQFSAKRAAAGSNRGGSGSSLASSINFGNAGFQFVAKRVERGPGSGALRHRSDSEPAVHGG